MATALPENMSNANIHGDFSVRGTVIVDRTEHRFPKGTPAREIARARKSIARDGLTIIQDGVETSGMFAGWHTIVAE